MEYAVAGVPGSTFHSPAIWEAYTSELRRLGSFRVRTVNMIEATVQELTEQAVKDGIKHVGVLSNTGSRSQQIYRRPLEAAGLKVLEVPEEIQPELDATIYDRRTGIKATKVPTPWAIDRFAAYADLLISKGAQILVLVGTEIPLVLPGKQHRGVPLVDPMVCLARDLLRFSNPDKLRPREQSSGRRSCVREKVKPRPMPMPRRNLRCQSLQLHQQWVEERGRSHGTAGAWEAGAWAAVFP